MKKYRVEIKPRAIRDLAHLPQDTRQRIVSALEKLESELTGDVKRLTNFTPEYRLRVGDYRVLFEIVNDSVIVYRICPRRDAYKKRG